MLLAALAIPASAAQTGVYVDEVVDYATTPVAEVVDISQYMCFESNPDLEVTHLVKAAHKEDVDAGLTYQQKSNHAEYIVYQMSDNIAGFELFLNCCAGLGDPMEDVSVFISKDGASWTEVKKQATELFYNDDIYIHFDKAYWHHAYVQNAQKIPKGYTYLKVQLNACNAKDDVPWNVAIDSVKIVLGDGVAVPTLPAIDKSLTRPSTTASTTTTQAQGGNNGTTTTTKAQGGNNGTTTTGQQGGSTAANGETTTTVADQQGGSTAANGETTTTVADQQGDVTTTTTAANSGAGDNADAEPNALPWIIGGAVALVVIVGGVLFVVLGKKKN